MGCTINADCSVSTAPHRVFAVYATIQLSHTRRFVCKWVLLKDDHVAHTGQGMDTALNGSLTSTGCHAALHPRVVTPGDTPQAVSVPYRARNRHVWWVYDARHVVLCLAACHTGQGRPKITRKEV